MTKTQCLLSRRVPAAQADQLGRLIEAYQSNQYLLAALTRARSALASARSYLATPGCNRALGEARIRHAEARRRAALQLLRANWIRVRDLAGSAA